ncbi:M24 family metallopeptidase [Alkalicoccus daliensis]|uniref:Xaa-Pro aminopeptidase. Metallo peptidase. MEROPS family M24B n=1 Tax=Alkalicoccus daliensis TaxID=745820 RepID=A0A1H0CBN4_9BACI|nr:Xaa-Pro peptidase family protein [Alkalicoccus daliensis]SDN55324.1 Xaa-Pro aminopeptidase. Metallo peptidase. MEROPS family M24B [Alkalicoccus daliensis]
MTRIEVLQEEMMKNNWDVLMVQTQPNVFYLSGFNADPHERLLGMVIFKDAAPMLICPNMEVNQIKEIFTQGMIIGYTDSENPWAKVESYIDDNNLSTNNIALESSISWSRLEEWKKIAPDAHFSEADSLLLKQRVIKSPEEITYLEEAAALADEGIQTGIDSLKEGITEMEVIAAIEYALKRKGVREMSFSPMVLFGEKAGDPHGNPGARKLKKGDGVLFDLGVMWKGYASDITRTVFFDHVNEEQQQIYDTVLAALHNALDLVKPGQKIGTLDTAARETITEAGYGEFFPHRIGHGLGIEVHEFPSMNAENTDLLQAGMTFTIEPGIYVPDKSGVRIEDDILVTEDGARSLTSYPKELTIIPAEK